jgi:thiol:disulfide interchange protein
MAAFGLLAWSSIVSAQLGEFGKLGRIGGVGAGLNARDSKVALSAEFTLPANDNPAMIFVTAKIAPGYHVYAVDQGKTADGEGPQPTAIKLVGDERIKLAGPFKAIQPPATHIDDLVWKGLELREHTGEVTWYAPLEVAQGVDAQNASVEVAFEGQACDANSCIQIETTLTAQLGKGMDIPVQPVQPMASPQMSLWAVAGYGILGGLILNLMPCVLPVIGLKVLSFAEQGGRSRSKVLALNIAYVAGLMAVFMVLALLATGVGVQLGVANEAYGWGELYTKLPFKVAMTGLVFAMALSFLGVWEIPIPGFAASGKATELSQQEGPVGAFCMGVFTTLLATPCSGPFLGPVFGYTISQPPLVTYIVFGSVGLGMSLPYLLIGVFPSLVKWLPKPGHWMETLKHLLGFVLLATVVYLFSTIHADYFLATLSLLFGIWFGCWLVGHVPMYAPRKARLIAWAGGAAVTALVGFASFTLLTPSQSPLPWQPYSPQALAVARAQGKTVLVDFTADWCLTCKTNLKLAINREEVKKIVEENDVVTLLADWTDENDTIKKALLELNSQSIPLLAIYPADPNRGVMLLPDLLTPGEVIEALKDAGPSLQHEVAAAADDQAAANAPEAPEFGSLPAATAVR